MESSSQIQPTAIRRYIEQKGMFPLRRLGFGVDGIVWETNVKTAVKGFYQVAAYENERNVYLRLL